MAFNTQYYIFLVFTILKHIIPVQSFSLLCCITLHGHATNAFIKALPLYGHYVTMLCHQTPFCILAAYKNSVLNFISYCSELLKTMKSP